MLLTQLVIMKVIVQFNILIKKRSICIIRPVILFHFDQLLFYFSWGSLREKQWSFQFKERMRECSLEIQNDKMCQFMPWSTTCGLLLYSCAYIYIWKYCIICTHECNLGLDGGCKFITYVYLNWTYIG